MLSFQNLFEFWPSTSHLWHTDASHNPSLAPRHGHAWFCSFKVGAYFTKAFSTLNCWAGRVWLVMGLWQDSIIDHVIKLPRWSFETLKAFIDCHSTDQDFTESHFCFWNTWFAIEVIDYFSQDGLILLHGFVIFSSFFALFLCKSVFQVTRNFSESILSHYEFSEAVPVHVCVGLCSFGHYIGINGLVVRLAIWNGCDSAVLYELLISFPDPVCMDVHMTQTTASTYPIPEQIIYWFIYSVCWCSLSFDRWLLRVALRDLSLSLFFLSLLFL